MTEAEISSVCCPLTGGYERYIDTAIGGDIIFPLQIGLKGVRVFALLVAITYPTLYRMPSLCFKTCHKARRSWRCAGWSLVTYPTLRASRIASVLLVRFVPFIAFHMPSLSEQQAAIDNKCFSGYVSAYFCFLTGAFGDDHKMIFSAGDRISHRRSQAI